MEKIFLRIILFITISSVLVNVVLPSVSFAQSSPQASGLPETLEGAKSVGIKALRLFPETFKGIWQEALGAWQVIFKKIKNFWANYINPWFQSLWGTIDNSFKKELKRREPIIEEEFKKEQKEIKEEAPRVGKSLWERFRELIK